MEFPEYWLRSPVASDAIDPAEFDALLERAILAGPESEIEYSLPAPKWQFLQHVIERGDIHPCTTGLCTTGACQVRMRSFAMRTLVGTITNATALPRMRRK
jgi:hypothetical protein